jgi:hypothetical protein
MTENGSVTCADKTIRFAYGGMRVDVQRASISRSPNLLSFRMLALTLTRELLRT